MRACVLSLANINEAREAPGSIILRTSWISADNSRREIQGRVLRLKENKEGGEGGNNADKAPGSKARMAREKEDSHAI